MMERVQDERKGFRRRIGCNNGDMRMEDFQPKKEKKNVTYLGILKERHNLPVIRVNVRPNQVNNPSL